MPSGKRSEGPRAPLFCSVLLIFSHVVAAQTVDTSTLELCANQETAELQLACFKAIVAAGRMLREEEAGAVETPAPERASTEADTTSEVAPPAANDDFGREYLVRRTEKQEEKVTIRATVTHVTRGRNKVLHFYLDNGHVWRQIEPRHFSYPKDGEFEISITRGMMGEYRLRIGDDGRMVKIRRVK